MIKQKILCIYGNRVYIDHKTMMNHFSNSLLILQFLCFQRQSYAFGLPDGTKVIDLQSQHEILSPAHRLRNIADSCEELGITEFDTYGDFQKNATTSFLRKFESRVAQTFGKDDAVFMPSGVMAQSIALLIHSKESKKNTKKLSFTSNRFACHHTSHLLLWEEESYKDLLDMDVIEISTKERIHGNGIHIPPLAYEDVYNSFMTEKEHFSTIKPVKLVDTGLSTFIIELPHRELGGKITTWQDVRKISALCKEEGIQMHCDGARIFEASAGYDLSLDEIAKIFDSIYVSFYKGLGSISGAMLLGDKDFCDEARVWLRRFGGNLYTLLPYAADSWYGFESYAADSKIENFHKRYKKLHCIVERIRHETKFDDIGVFDPPLPETNMIHVYLKASIDVCEQARDKVINNDGVSVFCRVKEIPDSNPITKDGFRTKFEWTIGPQNESIDNEIFVRSWNHFASELELSLSCE